MEYSTILEQAEHYVRSYFDKHVNEKLYYHNIKHTERVAEAATQIGQHYQLNDVDFFTVTVAAWFHDIGYLVGDPKGHEERGARLARAYLEGTGVDNTVIEAVCRCIIATQLPQRAVGLTEQIVCDADLYHLGTDDFSDRNKVMRKEAEAVSGRKISKEEWRRSAIRLLESHQYYTDYCRLLLNEKQLENLNKLKEKEPEASGNSLEGLLREHGVDDGDGKPAAPKEKKDKKSRLTFFSSRSALLKVPGGICGLVAKMEKTIVTRFTVSKSVAGNARLVWSSIFRSSRLNNTEIMIALGSVRHEL